jgi:hypothetical protein
VADVMDTIATMLQGAHYFAEQALKKNSKAANTATKLARSSMRSRMR